ncbi:hypothetical protein ASC96_18870 [Rhizobium sp. Root1204]|nr:hypothetical protein ASC96_18870 [Rhizobium sp. Root1204]
MAKPREKEGITVPHMLGSGLRKLSLVFIELKSHEISGDLRVPGPMFRCVRGAPSLNFYH